MEIAVKIIAGLEKLTMKPDSGTENKTAYIGLRVRPILKKRVKAIGKFLRLNQNETVELCIELGLSGLEQQLDDATEISEAQLAEGMGALPDVSLIGGPNAEAVVPKAILRAAKGVGALTKSALRNRRMKS